MEPEEFIADIATVFHWPPQSFDEMNLSELMKWHELAAKRIGQDDD